MLPQELLQKVRLIEIHTRKIVTDVLTGQYRSSFKGHGMQFSEHRIYVPGDDIRHIDWKVSARTRDLLVKRYEEERELTVFLVVDISGSLSFGSTDKLKSEAVAELSGMLAYASCHTGDRVGAILFAGEVEHIIPPRKGRQHVLRIIQELLSFKPRTQGTDLTAALDAAGRMMKHRGIIFVVSDFIANGYEVSLKRLARKHDVVAIKVGDAHEDQIPPLGRILFLDPESGKECFVDSGFFSFRRWMDEREKKFNSDLNSLSKGGRIEFLRVLVQEDYGEAVVRFFRARARAKAKGR